MSLAITGRVCLKYPAQDNSNSTYELIIDPGITGRPVHGFKSLFVTHIGLIPDDELAFLEDLPLGKLFIYEAH